MSDKKRKPGVMEFLRPDGREKQTDPAVHRSETNGVLSRRYQALHHKDDTNVEPGVSDRVQNAVQRWVDPSVCKMWRNHNRRYDLLSEDRCSDLVKDIGTHGQQLPAIVRVVHNDPEYTYEVICGARRHWTATHLGKKYYIEVKSLSDEEAFRLSDSENRNRKDISDYERAIDYKQALDTYYKTARKMAAAMDESEKWLSAYLALAEIPQEILDAYPSVIDVKYSHAAKLRALLKDKRKRTLVLAEAAALTGTDVAAGTVYKRLLQAGESTSRGRSNAWFDKPYSSRSGKTGVRLKKTARAGVQLLIVDESLPIDELVTLAEKALRDHFIESSDKSELSVTD